MHETRNPLWHRLAAVAMIRPLAWEPPYAASAALKRQKKKKKDIPRFVLTFLFNRKNIGILLFKFLDYKCWMEA